MIAGYVEAVSASIGMVIGAAEAVLGATASFWLIGIKQNSPEDIASGLRTFGGR